MRRILFVLASILAASTALAGQLKDFSFASIDGGTLEMSDWNGQPVLVVNTASQCGFTDQYEDMQTLYDRFRAAGLVVLAVPSDDFRQELDSAAEVKAFCDLNYGIDMPMTDITRVRGSEAHPFYAAVRDESGFVPRWNFNKILIAPDGTVGGTWGSGTRPLSRDIVDRIEALLQGA